MNDELKISAERLDMAIQRRKEHVFLLFDLCNMRLTHIQAAGQFDLRNTACVADVRQDRQIDRWVAGLLQVVWAVVRVIRIGRLLRELQEP